MRWAKLADVRWRRMVPLAVATASFLLLPFPLRAQQEGQQYQQFEVDRGATLYDANCAECHAGGNGVPGVNFRTGQFPTGSTDQDIISAIQNGIPGTAMTAHNFHAADLTALVAYIRSLAQSGGVAVKLGDPGKGRALFEKDGCLNCHRVGTEGGYTALNLSDAGALHPPAYLERALLDPNSVLAQEPQNGLYRIVTKSGKVIRGRRLNADTFTLQIMDSHGNLLSLDRSDLRSVTVLKQSPMPSVKGKLTDGEISDLVAYLASLKGGQTAVASYGSPPKIGAAYQRQGNGPGDTFGFGHGPNPPASASPAPAAPQKSGARP